MFLFWPQNYLMSNFVQSRSGSCIKLKTHCEYVKFFQLIFFCWKKYNGFFTEIYLHNLSNVFTRLPLEIQQLFRPVCSSLLICRCPAAALRWACSQFSACAFPLKIFKTKSSLLHIKYSAALRWASSQFSACAFPLKILRTKSSLFHTKYIAAPRWACSQFQHAHSH